MTKEFAYKIHTPIGAERYGNMPGIEKSGRQIGFIDATVELAPPSGVEYVPPIPTCIHVNLTTEMRCRGPRAKKTEYCIGHLNQQAKEAKKSKE
jgi:hypothetical protein